MSEPEPWTALLPGERFRVKSKSGNLYALTFLHAGSGESGFFARFESTRKPARFYPERLDWTSLEMLEPGALLDPGDEVWLATTDKSEIRGRVVATSPENVSLRLSSDKPLTVRTEEIVEGSLRLVFAATDWRVGDEFFVTSRSLREYRGATTLVSADRIGAHLGGREATPGREAVTLRVDQLDLTSFRVLIPLALSSMAPV